jgi:hypothetical protein
LFVMRPDARVTLPEAITARLSTQWLRAPPLSDPAGARVCVRLTWYVRFRAGCFRRSDTSCRGWRPSVRRFRRTGVRCRRASSVVDGSRSSKWAERTARRGQALRLLTEDARHRVLFGGLTQYHRYESNEAPNSCWDGEYWPPGSAFIFRDGKVQLDPHLEHGSPADCPVTNVWAAKRC